MLKKKKKKKLIWNSVNCTEKQYIFSFYIYQIFFWWWFHKHFDYWKLPKPFIFLDLLFAPQHTVELQWLEPRWLVYPGWFELFFQSLQNPSDSSRKQIFRIFFLFYHFILWIFLQTFQTYFCIQANSVDPDQTAPKGAVWSGSTLFAKMTFKITSRWQSRRQLLWLAV